MEEQEISLRELIETLLKNKFLIAFITIVCVLVAGVFSYFVIEPTYEAEAKILVSDLNGQKNKSDVEGIEGILESAASYPTFNMESYKEQIKNPEILNKVIEELKLDKEVYNVRSLAKTINVDNTKDTNILKIKVTNKNPEEAAKIANSLAANFSVFISNLTKKQADKSLEYVESQITVEEKNLNDSLVEYKNFLQQPQGVEELTSDQESKIKLITTYKEELSKIDIEIATHKANIEEVEKQLKETDPVIVTNKSITDDSLMLDYAKDKAGKNTKDVSNLQMKSEEVNPLYTTLQGTLSLSKLELTQAETKKKNLQAKISQTQKNLENIQVTLAEKKHQLEIVNRQVENAKNKYNALIDKSEEVRLAQSSKVGDAAVVVSSKAYPNNSPVAPRKVLNLAIALVLGLMMGAFLAFFKEYWKQTAIEK